ncbi:MAG: aspartate kinase [Pseudomonadota bacterium]
MLVVQKYGGTSVGSIARIKRVARRCLKIQRQGHQLAVVVSAMAGETNRLLALARRVSEQASDREVDVVVATGEQVSVGLLALAIRQLGGRAVSFLGHQVRVTTDSSFSRARILAIDEERLRACFADNAIAVVAGFQGCDANGSITTLGRGGSDTTGVAVAAALKADVCEIYTDVDGVYTADPNICPSAKKIERISYEEMLELASLGAKVLQIRSVELGMRYRVPIHVRSSFNHRPGTWVVPEEKSMEQVTVAGVSLDRGEAKVTLRDVPDRPGIAARIFSPLSKANIVVDMIIQNASSEGHTDVTFTVPEGDLSRTIDLLVESSREIGISRDGIISHGAIAKVSVVGVGMRSHAGVALRMFELLASEGINIQMISTSEIRISVVVDAKYSELAVRVLHDGFGLGKAPGERFQVA